MRFCALLIPIVFLAGCDTTVSNPAEYLKNYLSSQGGNSITVERNGIEFNFHRLNPEYFLATRLIGETLPAPESVDSLSEEFERRYGNQAYFRVDISPSDPSASGREFAALIGAMKKHQDGIARRSYLRKKGEADVNASAAVVNGFISEMQHCSMIIAFPISGKALSHHSLWLGGNEELPLDFSIQLDQLKPKVRFKIR